MSGITIGIASVTLVLFGASILQHFSLQANNFATVVTAVLVDLANNDRISAGVERLASNDALTRAAQAKASDMASRGYFAHTSPDGREPWDFMKDAQYNFEYAGENLAIQFADSEQVEKAWLDSAPHRANLLDTRFTEVGIATAQGFYQGQSTVFVVQMFGKPRKDELIRTTPEPIAEITETPVVASDSPVTPTENEVVIPAESAVLGVAAALGNTDATRRKIDQDPPVVSEIKSAIAPNEAPWWKHLAASPRTYINYALWSLVALLILFTGYIVYAEARQHHARHIIFALALCVAILALLYLANVYIFGDAVIGPPLPIVTG